MLSQARRFRNRLPLPVARHAGLAVPLVFMAFVLLVPVMPLFSDPWLRVFFLVGLYVVLALAGWAVAARAPDRFGRMLAAGLTAWLTFQAIVNIGGVLGVLPITGIALPFVSFGSTALIVAMASLGMLVNIAQAGVPPKT